ncbi:MAG TPA: tetratricopeptide repeat protein, partial [Candidatus Latescibacteria bacterium]|nr:tetratricopeptide repeat protein [Candidatus Latescibacterota bacterium]
MKCYNSSPTIKNNSLYGSQWGIYTDNSNAMIKDNSISVGSGAHGIALYNYSYPKICQPYGHNTITGSGQGVRCLSNSKPELGLDESGKWGNNNILTSDYDVYVGSEGITVYARRNWWGGSGPGLYTAPGSEVIWQPELSGPAKIATSGNPATELYRRSSLLLARGNYPEAISGFKRVIEDYPDSKAAESSLVELIFAYREMEEEEQALRYLEDVAAKHSHTPLGDAALRATVPVLSRLDLGEKALARVSALLERFKGTRWERDLLFSKGMIYKYNLREGEKAKQAFEDFLQGYPDDLVGEFAKLELGYDPTGPGREKAGGQGISALSLSQNQPNPFNAQTVISFALPRSTFVRLEVYN